MRTAAVGFLLLLLLLQLALSSRPAAAAAAPAAGPLQGAGAEDSTRRDADGNGRQDLLDDWLAGKAAWSDLRRCCQGPTPAAAAKALTEDPTPSSAPLPPGSVWAAGMVRLIWLQPEPDLPGLCARAAATGACRILHEFRLGVPAAVLAADEPGLRALLREGGGGRLMLDRDGVPALAQSRTQIGVPVLESAPWGLGEDWSATLAIIDSGCDTAHGDLGDAQDDDVDGPPPAVGDAADWYPASVGWSLFDGYKVVGWHDVTDDFPLAQGPWDYHHHGTALASVAAGAGRVDAAGLGVAPAGRLTVVKFYDFDQTWHAWAGDFLAACAWVVENRDTYRVRAALCAVNWDVDAGLTEAMEALLDAGIVPVAAMGNFGDDPAGPGYPARLPQVLTVGAVNDAGAVSAYSGRGLPGQGKPDLVAPGGGLLAAQGRIEAADNEPDDTYSGRVGTSLAAAHAAGAAYTLQDALARNGILLPQDRGSALTRMAVLKLAAAPVTQAESADGLATASLPAYAGHDPERGWGLLRVDAAVSALLEPLGSGRSQSVSLDPDAGGAVVARRLLTNPGVRYLVEAAPAAGLDVCLEIVDPRWLHDDPLGGQVVRRNASGAGVSEFAYIDPEPDSWFFAVVKVMSGRGTVTLSVREADAFSARGVVTTLPGVLSGAPSRGDLAGLPGPSLILPSRVTVDAVARALNVLDTSGAYRTGWPVFLFPHVSSQGGLTQALAWDLDGTAGDEIVVASEYGSVYFFQAQGQYQELELDFNNALSAPVGLVTALGERRVAVVDKSGVARVWAHGALLRAERVLGHASPLQPAAGTLVAGGGDALVVAFADGTVTALNADLQTLPGWPVALGTGLQVAPVLADLDVDGRHEVIVPAWTAAAGGLTMRVLDGQGALAAGDGAPVPPPGGGTWLALSGAVVGGGYQPPGLQVVLMGLAANGLAGDHASWILGQGTMAADGTAGALAWAGFSVRASTPQSVLTLDARQLPAPLVYDQDGDGAADPSGLAHVRWQDLLYGLTTIPGSATGWFAPTGQPDALGQRQGCGIGGALADPVGKLGAMLVPLQDGALLRVQVVDEICTLSPMAWTAGPAPVWTSARADGRNSGSYPLAEGATDAAAAAESGPRLRVFPNPGSGRVRFAMAPGPVPADLRVEIYDLRGRRVASLDGRGGTQDLWWEGRDEQGRPVAAGAYLALGRAQGRTWSVRIVLTR